MKAFPNSKYLESPDNGMDLRDYFAAKVMQGLLSQGVKGVNGKALAIVAYDVADKMMEERNIK